MITLDEDTLNEGHVALLAAIKYPDCEGSQRDWWDWSFEHGDDLFNMLYAAQ